MGSSYRPVYALLSLACVTIPVATVGASTTRHDVNLDTYINYGDSIRLVGGVSHYPNGSPFAASFGSGVLINSEWVLTAAHVLSGVDQFSQIRFETDPDPNDTDELPLSGLFGVTAVAIHPYYDDVIGPAGGFDLALLKLDAPLEHTAPYQRLRTPAASNAELGRVGTAVGFGALGTGITGYDDQTAGFFRVAGDNMLDAIASDTPVLDEFVSRDIRDPVTNQIIEHFTQEEIASQFMLSDFDDPASDGTYTNDGRNPLGDADPLALEANVAPGDSGGPVFVYENGQRVVAGINSFIAALTPEFGGDRVPTEDDPFGAASQNASYSDLAGYMRITPFNDWIDSVVGVSAVPEPGSLGLLAAAGLLAMRRRRSAAV